MRLSHWSWRARRRGGGGSVGRRERRRRRRRRTRGDVDLGGEKTRREESLKKKTKKKKKEGQQREKYEKNVERTTSQHPSPNMMWTNRNWWNCVKSLPESSSRRTFAPIQDV